MNHANSPCHFLSLVWLPHHRHMHQLLPAPASSAVAYAVHTEAVIPQRSVSVTQALLLSAHLPMSQLQNHYTENLQRTQMSIFLGY